jgi:hypothetical protein
MLIRHAPGRSQELELIETSPGCGWYADYPPSARNYIDADYEGYKVWHVLCDEKGTWCRYAPCTPNDEEAHNIITGRPLRSENRVKIDAILSLFDGGSVTLCELHVGGKSKDEESEDYTRHRDAVLSLVSESGVYDDGLWHLDGCSVKRGNKFYVSGEIIGLDHSKLMKLSVAREITSDGSYDIPEQDLGF